MSDNLIMEVEDDVKEVKKCKMMTCRRVSDDHNTHTPNRLLKRIMLCLTKPSYTLQVTALGNLRFENRSRLRCLLRQLVRLHNWEEASGVLSVLLKGAGKDKSPSRNRTKYTVVMELLKHIKRDGINTTKIQHVFELWMKKIGPMKNWPIKDKFMVRLEFILFCLTYGNAEDARQAAICLMQESEFGNDPISNMVVGLTFCQLWYSSLPKEMQLKDADVSCTSSHSEMASSRSELPIQTNPEWHDENDIHEANSSIEEFNFNEADSPSQLDSQTSIGNDKNIASNPSYRPRGFYMNSVKASENDNNSFSGQGDDTAYTSIFQAHGLDSWLLPLRLSHANETLDDYNYMHREMLSDYYKNAVKYLRVALYSTPPVFEALLPLIQMLLLGDQVKEALNELEKFCHNSETALPLRLKASLLERFNSNNHVKLSTCFEDILKKDPMCSHSLGRLIRMHQNGDYGSEQLLEMLALHLDATYGVCNIWKEFASCFLKLFLSDEDRMSVCIKGTDGGQKLGFHVRYNRMPKVFTDSISEKTWRLRCRWWLTRHFSQNMLASELAAGDLQLLAYKAASSSHIYGPDFDYVVKAYTSLGDTNRDLQLFLQRHMLNSIGLYKEY